MLESISILLPPFMNIVRFKPRRQHSISPEVAIIETSKFGTKYASLKAVALLRIEEQLNMIFESCKRGVVA